MTVAEWQNVGGARTAGDMAGAYRRYAGEVRRYLTRSSGCPSTAEDLTQEAFIRLTRIYGGEAVQDLRSYLFRIARNLLIDHHRAARARFRMSDIVELTEAHELKDDSPDAERIYFGCRELDEVDAWLSELPGRCRQIFWMSRVDGLLNREIATNLGVCLSAVEKNINRAARHCRSRRNASVELAAVTV